MFGPISLQSAKVIRIAQFGPQLLENSPIFLRSFRAELAGEVALQICCHSLVIQQRVVYVEQEDDASRRIIDFVHLPVAPSAGPLIAEMPRVCYAKMQQHIQMTLCDFRIARVSRSKRWRIFFWMHSVE